VTDFVIVLTTLPAEGDAERFASQLVEDRLAACVNILPAVRSVYRWKNAVERADERQLVIKTTRARVTALEARLRKLHPYDVPEFVVLPIDSGSAEYLSWLTESTKPQAPGS
jgi:periplasmic divalent cation tolerance protein